MTCMKRFLLTAVFALLGGSMSLAAESPAGDTAEAVVNKGVIGRPVRIISIGTCNLGAKEMAGLVDREAATGADLIVLPEMWPKSRTPVTLEDAPITALAAVAKKHHTYIVSPILRRDGDTVYNSSVVLDRQGKVAGVYERTPMCLRRISGGLAWRCVSTRSFRRCGIDWLTTGRNWCCSRGFLREGRHWGRTRCCTTITLSAAPTAVNVRSTT